MEKLIDCGYDCRNCDYCKELIDSLLHLRVLTSSKLEDMGLKEVAVEMGNKGMLS